MPVLGRMGRLRPKQACALRAQVRGEGADLAGLDEVQIVEAFFALERRLEAALAAARLPSAPAQAGITACSSQPHCLPVSVPAEAVHVLVAGTGAGVQYASVVRHLKLTRRMLQAGARVTALRRGLGAVYEAMPRDLQQTMLSSPARAALLQSLSDHTRVPGQPSRRPAV